MAGTPPCDIVGTVIGVAKGYAPHVPNGTEEAAAILRLLSSWNFIELHLVLGNQPEGNGEGEQEYAEYHQEVFYVDHNSQEDVNDGRDGVNQLQIIKEVREQQDLRCRL